MTFADIVTTVQPPLDAANLRWALYWANDGTYCCTIVRKEPNYCGWHAVAIAHHDAVTPEEALQGAYEKWTIEADKHLLVLANVAIGKGTAI